MNIFVLDQSPIAAAHMMCDKHIPKMVVETAQMMASALRRHGAVDEQMPIAKTSGKPYKGGYKHHPCTVWSGDSRANFVWLSLHGESLLNEYYDRYKKVHACHNAIYQMSAMCKMIPDGMLTPFAQAMPDEYRNPCAITAYRAYYHSKTFAKWEKGAPVPNWWRGVEVTA
jgi:hypothetical protein